MCAIHLLALHGVEVRTSGIPNAGNGLFAVRDIAKDECIVEMKGKRWKSDDDDDEGGAYVLEFQPGSFVDSDHVNDGFGRFCNDCRTVNQQLGQCIGNNARYVYDKIGDKIYIKSSRRIRSG